ncbi:MAG: ABC-F family ATP-binding cassette domain-containing protein [Microbacteriaceae bacterium]|jgi:ATPase subunit of ABC transporter with duplicated ATPase domains|nr:ABC-F family ATP-binding cassette domain-containing protein [Microbacteriaceae bacterium]MCI1207719.1 ABC-F family ATP-binding cassette domain-containing protein [Microbacteriaceae bacterium]
MAHLLGAERIGLSYPTKDVFSEVSLGLQEGQRVGIVGRNGDGKSTLLRLLSGEQEPDTGRVTRRGGIRVGMLPQTPSFSDGQTVREAVVGDLPEHEWASDPRVRGVISGLVSDLGWEAPVSELSGGQRRRVALAGLLRQEWDVLFLDEPTNHLDVEGIAWLAAHLRERWAKGAGGLVMVTHDRWFLDAVCTDTWEVHDQSVEPFEGGYAAYILQRVERDRQAQTVETKRRNLMRKELAWLGRGAPARSSKPKFHVDAAKALIADMPPVRDRIRLQALATARLGKDVIDVEHATVGYGEQILLRDATWRLGPGDRVGLLGANGAGKTTLLGLIRATSLQGEDEIRRLDGHPGSVLQEGRIRVGKTVRLAWLSQELTELGPVEDDRVRDVLGRIRTTYRVGDEDLTPTQLLERLGFATEQLSTPVRDLSGGQRRRLQLLLTLLDEPNVLVLDEPTNDLDTDMLAAMEDVLDAWGGTLIVVSHDRYFLERVTDRLYAVVGERLRDLPGGIDEYLALEQAGGGGALPPSTADSPRGAADAGRAADAPEPAHPGLGGAERHALAKRIAALERRLDRLRQDLAALDGELAAADQADFGRLQELSARRAGLSSEISEVEDAWLAASETLEGD